MGARCIGANFPPIAAPGNGKLSADSRSFYSCSGSERCPGNVCDCIGGVIESVNSTIAFRCGLGYLDGSPLCSLCDTQLGYAKTLGECKSCEMPSVMYGLISLLVIFVWFPVLSKITENFESLEILINFISFLGLYSYYTAASQFRPALENFLKYCSFFNVDIDMLHISCFGSLSYGAVWATQTFLPLLYPALCATHLFIAWVLAKLTERGLTSPLLRIGWRPRRAFHFESIRDSYLPKAMLFMHMYCTRRSVRTNSAPL